MNYTKLIAFVFFFCAIYSCEGNSQEDSKTIIEKTNTLYKDSIPFRFLPIKEQRLKSAESHLYGGYKLKRKGIKSIYYHYLDERQGIEIHENYPGVVKTTYRGGRLPDEELVIPRHKQKPKIDFYNSQTKRKIKTLLYENLNPYNGKGYKKGYPNGEYYEQLDIFDPDYKENAEDYYVYTDSYESRNGFVIIRNIAYPVAGKFMLGEETTLHIYNHKGVLLKKIPPIPYMVRGINLSDDGKYIGMILRNDFTDGRVGKNIFRIYELETLKIIYEQVAIEEQKFGGFSQIKKGFFHFVIRDKIKKHRIDYFFDFPNRIKYYRAFTEEDRKIFFKDFKDYSTLLDEIDFKQENF